MAETSRTSARAVRAARGPPRGVTWQFAGGSGRNTGGWQQQRRATSSTASRCRYEYGNDDGRLHQGKGSARASHPEAGPAHIRATSLPLSVPRRSLLCGGTGLWLRSGAGRAQLATSRVTGPVLAASSTSEMLYRSQWSRSGLSECIHVAVVGHHLMPV